MLQTDYQFFLYITGTLYWPTLRLSLAINLGQVLKSIAFHIARFLCAAWYKLQTRRDGGSFLIHTWFSAARPQPMRTPPHHEGGRQGSAGEVSVLSEWLFIWALLMAADSLAWGRRRRINTERNGFLSFVSNDKSRRFVTFGIYLFQGTFASVQLLFFPHGSTIPQSSNIPHGLIILQLFCLFSGIFSVNSLIIQKSSSINLPLTQDLSEKVEPFTKVLGTRFNHKGDSVNTFKSLLYHPWQILITRSFIIYVSTNYANK